ncbi:M23 family metallopeptidase [Lacimicrobium sp. SS2-24]|uniref:M23 family metallopeptidase n=1 Tax=Lacimicrobium sp. SS2-24 TaxID=2005569 RepID=UPI001FF05297|nr:M23 family metallopeptidase [Lacimicrobium sp. SS2-24]
MPLPAIKCQVNVALFMLMLSCSVAVTATPEIRYQGNLIQGGWITGEVTPGSRLMLNSEDVKVGEKGHFVVGFGRDASASQTLTVINGQDRRTLNLEIEKRDYPVQRIEGVAQKYVTPADSVLQRIAEDNRKIYRARNTLSEHLHFLQPFIWPAQGPVSGVYGSQRVFNGVPKRPHYGLDVAGPVGTTVVAPADGVVVLWVADMYYSGGTLILDHGFGVTSTFIHLSKSLVTEGDEVRQGDKIAEMGATGRTTGPHLDWRINWLSQRLDPQLLVPPR